MWWPHSARKFHRATPAVFGLAVIVSTSSLQSANVLNKCTDAPLQRSLVQTTVSTQRQRGIHLVRSSQSRMPFGLPCRTTIATTDVASTALLGATARQSCPVPQAPLFNAAALIRAHLPQYSQGSSCNTA